MTHETHPDTFEQAGPTVRWMPKGTNAMSPVSAPETDKTVAFDDIMNGSKTHAPRSNYMGMGATNPTSVATPDVLFDPVEITPEKLAIINHEHQRSAYRQSVEGQFVNSDSKRKIIKGFSIASLITGGAFSLATLNFVHEYYQVGYEQAAASLPGATNVIRDSYFDEKREAIFRDRILGFGAGSISFYGLAAYAAVKRNSTHKPDQGPNTLLLERFNNTQIDPSLKDKLKSAISKITNKGDL